MGVTMKRRLYFLFSNTDQARKALIDLDGLGVDAHHIHVLARPGADLSGLPPATDRQRRDILGYLEKTLWGGNLLLFGIACTGLLLSWVFDNRVGMILAVFAVLASISAGALFALRLPTTHLEEFHEALRHGELLLMVDVSRDCVGDVEALMRRRHPEAVTGGSGWTPGMFGV